MVDFVDVHKILSTFQLCRTQQPLESTTFCCNFGPVQIKSNDFPSYFATPSNTILTFVVDLPGHTTGKWDKYQQLLLSPLTSIYSKYLFLTYYSMTIQYFSPSSDCLINFVSILFS